MGCVAPPLSSVLDPSATADGTDSVTMENPPSISQIIKKDHRCFWLLLFLVFWWVVMGILWWFQITHPSRDPNENVLIAIFGLFSLAIAIAIVSYVSIR